MDKVFLRLNQDSALGKQGQVVELPQDEAMQAIHGGLAKRLGAGEVPPKSAKTKEQEK